MAEKYNKRPSEIIYLDDTYEAYCFDEACLFITSQWDTMENKWINKPRWSEDRTGQKDRTEGNSNKDFINFVEKFSKNN